MISTIYAHLLCFLLSFTFSYSVDLDNINTIDQADTHAIITPVEPDYTTGAEGQDGFSVPSLRGKLPVKRKRNAVASEDESRSKVRKGSESIEGLSRHQTYRLAVKARVSLSSRPLRYTALT